MKPSIAAFIQAMACILTGCTSTSKLTTSEVVLKHGSNEVRITQPKDTSFKDFMISPDGTVRIKDYRSTANEAAIASSERQADFNNNLMMWLMQRADQRIDQVGVPAARAYGIPVQPLPELTNRINLPSNFTAPQNGGVNTK